MARDAIETATSPATIEAEWENFLIATSGIYAKLEQGAKGFRDSEPWFGRKKHERKSDPVLRYLHHARNAEEHGIEEITKRASSHVKLGPRGAARFVSDGKNWTAIPLQGEIEFANDLVALVRVCDQRFGDSFDPPTQHLGRDLTDTSPAAVARLAVAYLEALIQEAASLPN